ncbi:WhiB family transcriptional regulator [Streptomyces sp. NPDC001274]
MTTTPVTGRRTTPAAADSDWRVRGACQGIDPELFWPKGESHPARAQAEQAKQVCRTCQVRRQCLEWAVEAREDFGVWGGLSERERRQVHRRKARSYGQNEVSAVDQILTERLDLFEDARSRGLGPGEIARELGTNVQTINNVIAALAEQAGLDAVLEEVRAA